MPAMQTHDDGRIKARVMVNAYGHHPYVATMSAREKDELIEFLAEVYYRGVDRSTDHRGRAINMGYVNPAV